MKRKAEDDEFDKLLDEELIREAEMIEGDFSQTMSTGWNPCLRRNSMPRMTDWWNA